MLSKIAKWFFYNLEIDVKKLFKNIVLSIWVQESVYWFLKIEKIKVEKNTVLSGRFGDNWTKYPKQQKLFCKPKAYPDIVNSRKCQCSKKFPQYHVLHMKRSIVIHRCKMCQTFVNLTATQSAEQGVNMWNKFVLKHQ